MCSLKTNNSIEPFCWRLIYTGLPQRHDGFHLRTSPLQRAKKVWMCQTHPIRDVITVQWEVEEISLLLSPSVDRASALDQIPSKIPRLIQALCVQQRITWRHFTSRTWKERLSARNNQLLIKHSTNKISRWRAKTWASWRTQLVWARWELPMQQTQGWWARHRGRC